MVRTLLALIAATVVGYMIGRYTTARPVSPIPMGTPAVLTYQSPEQDEDEVVHVF